MNYTGQVGARAGAAGDSSIAFRQLTLDALRTGELRFGECVGQSGLGAGQPLYIVALDDPFVMALGIAPRITIEMRETRADKTTSREPAPAS